MPVRRRAFCYNHVYILAVGARRHGLRIACGCVPRRERSLRRSSSPKKVTPRLCCSLVNALATRRLATNFFRYQAVRCCAFLLVGGKRVNVPCGRAAMKHKNGNLYYYKKHTGSGKKPVCFIERRGICHVQIREILHGGKGAFQKCRKPAGESSLKNAVRKAETQKTAKITAREISVVLLLSINLRIFSSSFIFQPHYITYYTKMRLKFGYKLLHICNN